jgi:hypothetical protein
VLSRSKMPASLTVAFAALVLSCHALSTVAQASLSSSNNTLQDMAIVGEQRISAVIGGVTGVQNIASW